MSGPSFPAVRLSPLVPGQGSSGEAAVDLPPSNKFGFAWPTDPSPDHLHSGADPSQGDSDLSEHETASANGDVPAEHSEDENTPTKLWNPLGIKAEDTLHPPVQPTISRAISMPLPSQLGRLQNPRRGPFSGDQSPASPVKQVAEFSQFHEISLELADSVQTMVQTLLQVSPSQVLDTAKEQFSACTLSVPTPSMSAMFTTMKNLNYISANMSKFCKELPDIAAPTLVALSDSSCNLSPLNSSELSDFDVGELLQSTGDALSGAAAQAGVDLVIYHGDVGMKHVSVQGDESGLSYALSHVVRQILHTAVRGDSIELGLFIASEGRASDAAAADKGATTPENASGDELEGTLQCTFKILHRLHSGDVSASNGGPKPAMNRMRPSLNTLLLRRLISHLGASLQIEPSESVPGSRVVSLAVTMEPGSPDAVNTPAPNGSEGSPGPVFLDRRISSEPELGDLLQFADTLRGKKVTLFASSKGSFAHHLTSYLTAWGMDVSHVSLETGAMESGEPAEAARPNALPTLITTTPSQSATTTLDTVMENSGSPGLAPAVESRPPSSSGPPEQQPISFMIIDDDVDVLRERLQKLRLEQPYQVQVQSRKRPALASHHRPRSSPAVARAMGLSTLPPTPTSPVVVVHFTSLSNYKQAKDAIQSILTSSAGPSVFIPEVLIIPKPAGPRRFLTALHTAVTKPVVDPFFVPIATSPASPGLHSSPPYYGNSSSAHSSPKSPTNSRQSRSNSERSNRSPKDSPLDGPTAGAPPSPLAMSEGMEYFSEAAVKLGTSASSGLVIQSPDGQPAGIFFHPRARPARHSSSNLPMERDRRPVGSPSDRNRVPASRRSSEKMELSPNQRMASFSALSRPATPAISNATLAMAEASESSTPKAKSRRSSSPRVEEPSQSGLQVPPAPRRSSPLDTLLRKVGSPPASPLGEPSSPPSRRQAPRRLSTAERTKPSSPPAVPKKPKTGDGNIVPPISVLIVDDNPINQTILSTFMKKKKIKFDVAKNGQEAVEKWRTGGFHLILMDIQMPVMDGIQATKEIRRTEKSNALAGYPTSTPRTEDSPLPLKTPSEVDSRSSASPYRSSVIIVALTASSLQSDRVAALGAGCNDFLTKPVSLQWLNNKIIEWGSIKALQMWADLRPEAVKSMSTDQAVQARNVALRLHVPEGRRTPSTPGNASPMTRNALGGEALKTLSPSSIEAAKSLMASAGVTPLTAETALSRQTSEDTPYTPDTSFVDASDTLDSSDEQKPAQASDESPSASDSALVVDEPFTKPTRAEGVKAAVADDAGRPATEIAESPPVEDADSHPAQGAARPPTEEAELPRTEDTNPYPAEESTVPPAEDAEPRDGNTGHGLAEVPAEQQP